MWKIFRVELSLTNTGLYRVLVNSLSEAVHKGLMKEGRSSQMNGLGLIYWPAGSEQQSLSFLSEHCKTHCFRISFSSISSDSLKVTTGDEFLSVLFESMCVLYLIYSISGFDLLLTLHSALQWKKPFTQKLKQKSFPPPHVLPNLPNFLSFVRNTTISCI